MSNWQQKKNEQRRFPRVEVQLNVDIKTTYVYTTASVVNISERGLFIRTQNPLPVESEIEIQLYFPDAEKPFKFVGVVRWVRKATIEIPAGMGVELKNPDKKSLKLLNDQISSTPKNF